MSKGTIVVIVISIGVLASILRGQHSCLEAPVQINLDNVYIVDDRDYPEDCFEVWHGDQHVGYYCNLGISWNIYEFELLD